MAGAWNELTPRQVRMMVRVLYSRMPVPRALVWLTAALLELWKQPKLAYLIVWRMDEETRYDLTRIAEWVFEKKNDLVKNPVKRVTVWRWAQLLSLRRPWVTMYGPKDELSVQCFLEFIKCETYFLKWAGLQGEVAANAEAEATLDKMMAVLYRPGAKVDPLYDTGDRRDRYNDNVLDSRALLMRQVPLHYKIAVMRYYEGVRETVICPKFRNVFPVAPEVENSEKPLPKPQRAASGANWLNQLRGLAGGALNMEKMANEVDRDVALFDLDLKIAEWKEMERNSKGK